MRVNYIQWIRQHCFKKSGSVNGRINDVDWWKKRNAEYIKADILHYTSFLNIDSPFRLRIYHYINQIDAVPKCERTGCDATVNWQVGTLLYSKFCSPKCNCISNAKYGADNVFTRPTVIEKIKKVNLEKYGAENYAKTAEFSTFMREFHEGDRGTELAEKIRITNNERYGVDYPFESDMIRSKAKESLMINHSVDSPLKNKDILAKQRQTTKERYGVESYNQSHYHPELFKHLDDKEWMEEQLSHSSVRSVASEFGISHSALCARLNKLGISLASYSSFEVEIYQYIQSIYDGSIIRGDRTILDGKEIDIYLPEFNLGIECDGLYWHSEKSTHVKDKFDRNGHLKKTETAHAAGVRLLHIFESEWYLRGEIVKERLANFISKKQIRVAARKCAVKQIQSQDERSFLNTNHLQGHVNSKICYGLYHDDELVEIMSFGKSRFSKIAEWELLRLCTKKSYSVIGGASKLLAHFEKYHAPKSIVSYADRRWFSGKVYSEMKFKFSHNSAPSYWYTIGYETIESRMKFQKHKLSKILPIFDSNLTEWENMKNNNYGRIWDCGNQVWVKHFTLSSDNLAK